MRLRIPELAGLSRAHPEGEGLNTMTDRERDIEELCQAAENAKRALYRVASVLYSPEKEQLHQLEQLIERVRANCPQKKH